jgi:dimethylhistidine N-methyltransferase
MASVSEMISTVEAAIWDAAQGLMRTPKTLPAWLLYDAQGTLLFEQITELREYYPTRTERALLSEHADSILELTCKSGSLNIVELGAGTATKTGILLSRASRRMDAVLYQPVDVSLTALAIAKQNVEDAIPGVEVVPQLANYVTQPLEIRRVENERVLMLYLGSSIGNFLPWERKALLDNIRRQLRPGDFLLIGVDLLKDKRVLLPAYDDADGVTAAFNQNVLARLNRELNADFDIDGFAHLARWNVGERRIEMHLQCMRRQEVRLLGPDGETVLLTFDPGETIHTENSYKFTTTGIISELSEAGFEGTKVWIDDKSLYSLTLVEAVDQHKRVD